MTPRPPLTDAQRARIVEALARALVADLRRQDAASEAPVQPAKPTKAGKTA